MRLIEASSEYRDAFLDLARVIEKNGGVYARQDRGVLIVKGDPLQDLKALSNVQYVIHNGEVIREPGETSQ